MNAYELADVLENNGGTEKWEESATMLRQQAHRITELEFNIRMNEMKYLEMIEELKYKNQLLVNRLEVITGMKNEH